MRKQRKGETMIETRKKTYINEEKEENKEINITEGRDTWGNCDIFKKGVWQID